MYDKEKIYDKEIYPLMSQIIEICKENDIQMFATYTLKEVGEIACTTYIESEEYNNNLIRQIASWVVE